MSIYPQYIIDEKGKKNFVILPYKEWEELKAYQRKVEILTGIKEGIEEVREAKKSGEYLQTLTDFLNESSS